MSEGYYAKLSAGYAETIRQLVPAYDDMTETLVSMLALSSPQMILDIGPGAGNLTHRVLHRLPRARLIGVETCDEMVAEANRVLADVSDRCEIRHMDILDFQPSHPLDAVYSNLVLHNIPSAEKRRLLKRIDGWLAPAGVFVWGDLIRYNEPDVQAHFVAERIAYARASGCEERLVRQSFGKEETEDHPWTVVEMLAELKSAGFADPQCVWCHDTFAIVLATKAS